MVPALHALGCLLALAAGPVEESPAERRAVRGVPVDDGPQNETPELREVRRFDEQAFPRDRGPVPIPADDAAQPLPAGLDGRWSGSGDLPPELRTPASQRPARVPPPPESEWLRQLALPDLPVRWEPQVIRYVEWFKNDPRARGIMSNWLRKLGRYRATFDKVLEREGVPRDLVYLAMIESGFEPGAMSRVGAGGIWQFMPGVARAYGLEVSHWVDARRDPERAVEAAARYLKDLHVRFGSWPLAFAGFHAGYGAVLTSIKRYNTNDYWELCKHEAGLPWETTLYVPKILAAAIVGHNLQAFGYQDVASDPPLAYDRVDAAPGTTLAAIARAAGTRPEVIEGLNPHLTRGRTPPDRAAGPVRVPPGSGALYTQAIEGARGAADRVETVVLRFGESLEEVARSRGLAVKDLKKLNGIKDSGEVRAGTTVVVPARGAAAPVVAKAPAPEDEDQILVAVPERSFSYEGRERVFYRTRDGDTVDEIAGAFGVRVEQLVEWNNLDPDAKLHPRLVLQLFVRKDFDRSNVALLDPGKVRVVTLGSEEFLALEAARRGKTRLQYVARAGDTLARIARRYGLQPGDLARINRLSYNSELEEGQRIVVYSPTPELPREVTVGRAGPHRRPPDTGGKRPPVAAKPNGKTPAVVAVKSAARPGAPLAVKPAVAKIPAKAPAPASKAPAKATPKH
jgi:membrane-bound lytic murein transglycosylase D